MVDSRPTAQALKLFEAFTIELRVVAQEVRARPSLGHAERTSSCTNRSFAITGAVRVNG